MRCAQCTDDGRTCDECGVPARFVPQNAADWRDWHPVRWRLSTWPRAGPGTVAPFPAPPPAADEFTADELADVLAVIDRAAASAKVPTADELEAAAETDADFAAYEAELVAVYEAELATERVRRNAEDRWVDATMPTAASTRGVP